MLAHTIRGATRASLGSAIAAVAALGGGALGCGTAAPCEAQDCEVRAPLETIADLPGRFGEGHGLPPVVRPGDAALLNGLLMDRAKSALATLGAPAGSVVVTRLEPGACPDGALDCAAYRLDLAVAGILESQLAPIDLPTRMHTDVVHRCMTVDACSGESDDCASPVELTERSRFAAQHTTGAVVAHTSTLAPGALGLSVRFFSTGATYSPGDTTLPPCPSSTGAASEPVWLPTSLQGYPWASADYVGQLTTPTNHAGGCFFGDLVGEDGSWGFELAARARHDVTVPVSLGAVPLCAAVACPTQEVVLDTAAVELGFVDEMRSEDTVCPGARIGADARFVCGVSAPLQATLEDAGLASAFCERLEARTRANLAQRISAALPDWRLARVAGDVELIAANALVATGALEVRAQCPAGAEACLISLLQLAMPRVEWTATRVTQERISLFVRLVTEPPAQIP